MHVFIQVIDTSQYPGFGWDRADLFFFLVGTIVLCFGLNMGFGMSRIAENILMVLVVAKKLRTFSVSHVSIVAQVYQKLEGSSTRATNTNWPKEYSLSHNIMLSIQMKIGQKAGYFFQDCCFALFFSVMARWVEAGNGLHSE